jgi:tetratricopeptide (TPR) repeat protein
MIVKNEEKFLEGCLESVNDIVDEIVVVDTGSTDSTKEIALRHGAKVISVPWSNDFSAARNESLRHATGDWILYLDADERLAPGQTDRLRMLLTKKNAFAYALAIHGIHHLPTGQVEQVNSYPRLFRSHPAVRFEGRVHEQIAPSLERLGKSTLPTDIVIEHFGYAESLESVRHKCRRNAQLLRDELGANPNDHYARYQLGNTLSVLEEYESARKELERALQGNLSAGIRASTLNLLTELAIRSGEYRRAAEYAQESLKCAEGQTLARWYLAAAHLGLQEHEIALAPLEEIIGVRNQKRSASGSEAAHDVRLDAGMVWNRLGGCYESIGRTAEASNAFFQAIRSNKDTQEAVDGFLRCLPQGDLEAEIARLEELRTLRAGGTNVLLKLAEACFKTNRIEQASSLVQQVLALEPSAVAAFELKASINIASGNLTAAEEVVETAEINLASSYNLHKYGASLALGRGDVHKAYHHLEKMIEYTPESAPQLRPKMAILSSRMTNLNPAQ